jgi:hypothetical protein
MVDRGRPISEPLPVFSIDVMTRWIAAIAVVAGLFAAAGGLIAACGAGMVALARRKGRPAVEAPPFELPRRDPRPISACDHDFVDQDEMSNNDPRHLRCSKCGEDRYG